MIKKIIGKLVPNKIKKQLVNFKILSVDYGQYRTIKNWDCVDKNQNKIAWYTYPAIEYLNNLDFSQKSIFEFGSGNSSKYWAERAKDVTSIEHDKQWYEKVKLNLRDNQTLQYQEDNQNYENSILELNKKFDIVIIDGIRREECSKVIEQHLNHESDEGFIVILDNSDWYKETSKYFREELNLIEIDFHGFGPINSYTWTTSIFLSRSFNFKPIDNTQPNFSISAIKNTGE
jgi:hypothetical protein